MPIRHYRSYEEAQADLWTTPDDPLLWQRIQTLWRRSDLLLPRDRAVPPRGIRRFRTSAEADAERVRRVRSAPTEPGRPGEPGSDQRSLGPANSRR